jgi:acyl-CoA reductase-like NAD-dependent aldehyde dehydrogenase
VDKAVKAAKAALKEPSWKQLSASDRGRLMWRLADLMEAKRELFATIEAWDNGKKYLPSKSIIGIFSFLNPSYFYFCDRELILTCV